MPPSDDSASTPPRRRLSGLQPDALMALGMTNQGKPSDSLLLPGYEIEAPVGRGGMGAVFLAHQLSLNREVAVKVLNDEQASDPLFLDRLEREAQTMARLRHPHIVTVHDFHRTADGGAAIVMEYVEGGSLRDLLRQHPCGLPVDQAVNFLQQIASGLQAAHASGIIHRDMKPENVLIDRHGIARVTDFGLALPLNESTARLTLTGATVGTVDYMAPEQLRGADLDARTDLFAVGVIAYELLTGQTPRGSFDPPHRVRADIPVPVSAAVMQSLRPQPEQRFPSLAAFVEALTLPQPQDSTADSGLKPRLRAEQRSWLPWVIGASALVLLTLGIIAFAPDRSTIELAPAQAPAPSPSSSEAKAPPKSDNQATAAVAVPPSSPAPAPTAPAATEPAPQAGRPYYEFGPWRDALTGVDVQKNTITGGWQREGASVVSNGDICTLELIRDDLPVAFDVRATFTRLSGADSVAIFAWINASLGSFEFDSWQLGLSGLQLIMGVSLEQGDSFRFSLENGRKYELLLEIRPAYARFVMDGKELKTYHLGWNDHCWPPAPWGWTESQNPIRLALASYKSPTKFDKVEWRAARLAPAPAAALAPP